MIKINIFLSYRREDSRHQAGRLYDRLVTHFGSARVFKDVDSIPLGRDFREVLAERVAACDVFLAVIGDEWLSISGRLGIPRLDDPGDFVRIEIEAALNLNIPVIPVLVGNSSVPPAESLPRPMRDLSFRNGLAVRPDPDFHKDVDRLIRGIEEGAAARRQQQTSRKSKVKESAKQPPGPGTSGRRKRPRSPIPDQPEEKVRRPFLPAGWTPRSIAPFVIGIASALAFAAMIFGLMYRITDKGRIKIEVNEPNARVFVDGKEVQIEGSVEPITLWSGEHLLTVKRGTAESIKWGHIEDKTRKFVVSRGENPPLTIELPVPSAPVDAKIVGKIDRSTPTAPDFELYQTQRAKFLEEEKAKLLELAKPEDSTSLREILKGKTSPPPALVKKAIVSPPKGDLSIITNSLGMRLKLIPAGTFEMGAPDDELEAFDHEKPRHAVRITKPFYLGIYEVTQGEYWSVTGTKRGWFAAGNLGQRKVYGMDTSRFPVETVSWIEAVAFCNKLSEREKLQPCYGKDDKFLPSGTGYRLPTEAEWEYACRAGTTTAFAFGGRLSTSQANFNGSFTYNGSAKGTFLERTAAVGSYLPNEFGLYDMHGNVFELCSDWYELEPYKKSSVDDPSGPTSGVSRMIRGGYWESSPESCRSAARASIEPDFRAKFFGFRVARDLPRQSP